MLRQGCYLYIKRFHRPNYSSEQSHNFWHLCQICKSIKSRKVNVPFFHQKTNTKWRPLPDLEVNVWHKSFISMIIITSATSLWQKVGVPKGSEVKGVPLEKNETSIWSTDAKHLSLMVHTPFARWFSWLEHVSLQWCMMMLFENNVHQVPLPVCCRRNKS